MDARPLSDVWFADIFFRPVRYLFMLSIVFFEADKVVIWMQSNLCRLWGGGLYVLWVSHQEILAYPRSQNVSL